MPRFCGNSTPIGASRTSTLTGRGTVRSWCPSRRLLSLYREGELLLDETVTAEYKLNDINNAYDDMLAGRNIRGVIIHDH
jgi:Zn-dependent alcohol dehydrogenase